MVLQENIGEWSDIFVVILLLIQSRQLYLENMSIRVMLIGGTRVGWVIAE